MSFLRRFGGNSTPAAGSAVPVVEVVEKREWHNEKEGERYFGMENVSGYASRARGEPMDVERMLMPRSSLM